MGAPEPTLTLGTTGRVATRAQVDYSTHIRRLTSETGGRVATRAQADYLTEARQPTSGTGGWAPARAQPDCPRLTPQQRRRDK